MGVTREGSACLLHRAEQGPVIDGKNEMISWSILLRWCGCREHQVRSRHETRGYCASSGGSSERGAEASITTDVKVVLDSEVDLSSARAAVYRLAGLRLGWYWTDSR